MPKSGKKYAHLLTTAEALFLQFGIRRVSVEEICRKAGISKATFYKSFANRGELAVAVLNRLTAPLRQQMESELLADTPYAGRLLRLLAIKRQSAQLLGPNLIQDLTEDPPPEIQAWLTCEQEKSYTLALRFLQQGQAAGILNSRFPSEFLFYLLDLGNEIFQDPRFKSLFPDILERGRLLNEFILFGLMAPPDEAPGPDAGGG
ncbi:MAG: TetR/AcrR family transcriptional regulator [Candidatus Sericytochromatia bacterium]